MELVVLDSLGSRPFTDLFFWDGCITYWSNLHPTDIFYWEPHDTSTRFLYRIHSIFIHCIHCFMRLMPCARITCKVGIIPKKNAP